MSTKPTDTVLIGTVKVQVRRTPWGVVATITPEVAAALLTQNHNNRVLRRHRTAIYGRDMHRWQLNGETITFYVDGSVANGQHRLTACVDVGHPFETYIIGDIDPAAGDSIDIGIGRTAGDMLGRHAEPDGRNLAAALLVCWKLDVNGHLGTGASIPYPTRTDLFMYLEDNPTIRLSMPNGSALSKSVVRYRRSLGTALHFLTSRIDEEAASDFWARLEDGVGLYPGHPVLALRTVLIREIGQPRRLEAEDVAALTVKAWNAYRRRANIKHLRWRRRGDNPESFPAFES